MKRISVIGAGALGSYYATKFHDLDKESVHFVAGGDRYERLVAEGIVVNGRTYHVPVVQAGTLQHLSDLVLVAVKYDQLAGAIKDLEAVIGGATTIISVMNGIDSEEMIGKVYGMEKLLYGVVVGIDAVRTGNETRFTREGKLIFGEATNTVLSERVRVLQDLFGQARILYETPEDMMRILWWKYMVNVGINQASAVLGAPYGVFQNVKEARELMESAMREVIRVAEAAGISLHESDIEDWYRVLSGLSPEGKTSMLQDIEAGRKTEVEMFAGKLVRLGEHFGLAVPVNETLLRIIRAMERRYLSPDPQESSG